MLPYYYLFTFLICFFFQVFKNTYTAHYTIYTVSNEYVLPSSTYIRYLTVGHHKFNEYLKIDILCDFSHQTPLIVNGSDVKISELQSAEWAGNTNNIILVQNNDIYVKYEINHEEVRITNSGLPGIIYNGVPDWLYQGKGEK